MTETFEDSKGLIRSLQSEAYNQKPTLRSLQSEAYTNNAFVINLRILFIYNVLCIRREKNAYHHHGEIQGCEDIVTTNKTDRHDITDILSKLTLNRITVILTHSLLNKYICRRFTLYNFHQPYLMTNHVGSRLETLMTIFTRIVFLITEIIC
jgi:hypothetical protein